MPKADIATDQRNVRFIPETRADVASLTAPLFEFLPVTDQRLIAELECRRLHLSRSLWDIDRGADLLEKRGVVEKHRLSP